MAITGNGSEEQDNIVIEANAGDRANVEGSSMDDDLDRDECVCVCTPVCVCVCQSV